MVYYYVSYCTTWVSNFSFAPRYHNYSLWTLVEILQLEFIKLNFQINDNLYFVIVMQSQSFAHFASIIIVYRHSIFILLLLLYWKRRETSEHYIYNWQIKITESLVGVKQLKVQLKYGMYYFSTCSFLIAIVVVSCCLILFQRITIWMEQSEKEFIYSLWMSEWMKKKNLTRLMD